MNIEVKTEYHHGYRSVVQYVNGIIHGEAIGIREDETIFYTTPYVNGEWKGIYKSYYKDKSRQYLSTVKKLDIHGIVISF